MQISRPLVAFAFVKESIDNTGDFVQGLVPLFTPIVREFEGNDFSPIEFSEALNRLYGLLVRPEVIEDWARRLADHGLLHPVEEDGEIVRYINMAPKDAAEPINDEDIEYLLDEFVAYVSSKLREVDTVLDQLQVEDAIFKRLKSMDFHDLIHKRQPSLVPERRLRLRSGNVGEEDENEELEFDSLEARLDFLCANYALGLRKSSPEKFDILFQIAGGALISEVVLYLRAPPKQGQDASNLSIYLDPPIVLDAMDLGNEEEYEFAHSLLEQLRNANASLKIFNSGVDELKRIFHRIIRAYPVDADTRYI